MTWGKRRALVILIVICVLILIVLAATLSNRIPANSVLVLDVNGAIQEQRPQSWLNAVAGGWIPTQHDFTDAIDTARFDRRIVGLVVRVGPLESEWAKLEEIRQRILEFRKSGKPSICYLEADGTGNPEYYVASACQQVWLVPTAPVAVRGMMAAVTFLRGTLDKLKIVPDFYHIGDFKTATNELTEKKFTPAHREEDNAMLQSIYNQYLNEASESRGMARADFENLVKQGPFESGDALKNKLVDRLAYWDQLQEFFRDRHDGWNPVDLGQYRIRIRNRGAATVAVIHATGLIVSGESDTTPNGDFIMGGDSVSEDIRRAREDSNVKAIILRIDSGGGSAVASEVIRREVELAKKEKPVVVSMSDVAASGGYWIAMDADKIVAEPDTITGSIGVLIGKMNLSGLYGLLGLSTDYISTADNATMYWDQQNFTPAQQQAIQKSMQQTYASFIAGVAAGRHMTVEAVDKIGKGRVWTGAQAKQIGLIDDIGGFDRALADAKQLAHIPANEPVTIERWPKEKGLLEQLFEHDGDESARTQLKGIQAILRFAGFSSEPIQARLPFNLNIR